MQKKYISILIFNRSSDCPCSFFSGVPTVWKRAVATWIMHIGKNILHRHLRVNLQPSFNEKKSQKSFSMGWTESLQAPLGKINTLEAVEKQLMMENFFFLRIVCCNRCLPTLKWSYDPASMYRHTRKKNPFSDLNRSKFFGGWWVQKYKFLAA